MCGLLPFLCFFGPLVFWRFAIVLFFVSFACCVFTFACVVCPAYVLGVCRGLQFCPACVLGFYVSMACVLGFRLFALFLCVCIICFCLLGCLYAGLLFFRHALFIWCFFFEGVLPCHICVTGLLSFIFIHFAAGTLPLAPFVFVAALACLCAKFLRF